LSPKSPPFAPFDFPWKSWRSKEDWNDRSKQHDAQRVLSGVVIVAAATARPSQPTASAAPWLFSLALLPHKRHQRCGDKHCRSLTACRGPGADCRVDRRKPLAADAFSWRVASNRGRNLTSSTTTFFSSLPPYHVSRSPGPDSSVLKLTSLLEALAQKTDCK
jgi:hypothetical protein